MDKIAVIALSNYLENNHSDFRDTETLTSQKIRQRFCTSPWNSPPCRREHDARTPDMLLRGVAIADERRRGAQAGQQGRRCPLRGGYWQRRRLAPVIADLQGQGHTSLRALARELNASGMKTRRGGRWHVSTVRNLLERPQQVED